VQLTFVRLVDLASVEARADDVQLVIDEDGCYDPAEFNGSNSIFTAFSDPISQESCELAGKAIFSGVSILSPAQGKFG
jgi:hypothetical protein